MHRIDALIIRSTLNLSCESTGTHERTRCEEYLLDRPLTVEPMLQLLLDAGDATFEGRRVTLDTLRLVRASVRALDDLLDQTLSDPCGRPAAWVSFGRDATVDAALSLWERGVATAPAGVQAGVVHESGCLLAAAALEGDVTAHAAHSCSSLLRLSTLERRIRDKEWAYWRLIARLVGAQWRSAPEQLSAAQILLVQLGDQWQRADDVRDLDDDLRGLRLSSFIVELLAAGADGSLPSLGGDGSLSLAARLERLERDRDQVSALSRVREVALAAEEKELRRALASILGVSPTQLDPGASG